MDGVLNAWKRKLCGVKKGVDERIDEGSLAMWRGWRGEATDGHEEALTSRKRKPDYGAHNYSYWNYIAESSTQGAISPLQVSRVKRLTVDQQHSSTQKR